MIYSEGCQTLLDCVNAIHSYERHADQRSSDSHNEALKTLITLATELKNQKILHKWILNNNIPYHYIEM